MSDFTKRLADLSPEKRALLLQRQEKALAATRQKTTSGMATTQTISRRNDSAPPPLSLAQEEWWNRVHLKPDDPWGCSAGVRIKGALKVEALEHSLNEIIRRHEPLRTTFTDKGGTLVQIIAPVTPRRLPVIDLSTLAEEEREPEVERQALEQVKQPFNLERGPLFQVTLYRLDDEDHAVLLTRHRMILDGWSSGVLLREMMVLYMAFSAGRPSPLPELPIQFSDFTSWQRQWLHSAEGEAGLAYWKRKLRGATPIINLPYDRPRPARHVVSPTSGTGWTLPATLSESVMTMTRGEGVTLFMTMLATFYALLHRLTGQEDLCVATYSASRNRPETESLLGVFLNTVVLRTKMSGETRFRELLQQVKEVTLEAFQHQEIPFSRVANALYPDYDRGSSHPLTRVRCRYGSSAMVGVGAKLRHGTDNKTKGINMPLPQGLSFSRIEIHHLVSHTEDLGLGSQDEPNGIGVSLDYATDWFDDSTIERMLQQMQSFLEVIVRDPDQPLAALPL
jgi:hypothetical protein